MERLSSGESSPNTAVATITQPSKEAQFYMERMNNFFSLRDAIDDNAMGPQEEYEGLNLKTVLRPAILKGVLGSYRMLASLGYSDVAVAMIRQDRQLHFGGDINGNRG